MVMEPSLSAGSLEGFAPDTEPGCRVLPTVHLLAVSCRVWSEDVGQGLRLHGAHGTGCVAWLGAACHYTVVSYMSAGRGKFCLTTRFHDFLAAVLGGVANSHLQVLLGHPHPAQEHEHHE